MAYDFYAGEKRVLEILNSNTPIYDKERIPCNDNILTFENAYFSWVTAIFVDIRDSSTLFTNSNKSNVSKIVRAFTSEIIEILRIDDDNREIGIRGDCVYGIFSTPTTKEIHNAYLKTLEINEFIELLNSKLSQKALPNIRAGIGMAAAKDLVIKAGRKGVNINSKVWIGEAVTTAANLSSLADKDGRKKILYSECAFNKFKKHLQHTILTGYFGIEEGYDSKVGKFHGTNNVTTKVPMTGLANILKLY